MTMSIDDDLRQRATQPPEPAATNNRKAGSMIRGVRIFTCVAAAAGATCLGVALGLDEWRTALTGTTLIILAAIGAAVWVIDARLADRHDFYRRGKVDGWVEGWRGQPPAPDDPLLRG